ncbi:MAG: HAMP domain-containing sensor histidine kinase [Bdellovibrionota bacterium]
MGTNPPPATPLSLATALETAAGAVGARAAALYRLLEEPSGQRLEPLLAAGERASALRETALRLPGNKLSNGTLLLSAGDSLWVSQDPRVRDASPAGTLLCGIELAPGQKVVLGLFGSKGSHSIEDSQAAAAAALLRAILTRSQTGVPEGAASAPSGTIQERVQQLEAEASAQAEFLAGLGHELKTPLNAIIGFSSLLERQIRDEEILEEVEMISLSAEKLLTLIDDLIDAYKIQAGKLVLHRDLYSLNDVIANSVETIRVIADERNIHVRAYLDNTIPEFPFDSKRIQQVMVNLLGNAVKFVPSGGEIIVRSNRESDRVRVQVADTGEGIPPEVLPRLFQRFQQAPGSEMRDTRSAGLGLALCRDFVEMHGGTIGVTSEHGKGSIFTFTLPLNPPAESADSASPPNAR